MVIERTNAVETVVGVAGSPVEPSPMSGANSEALAQHGALLKTLDALEDRLAAVLVPVGGPVELPESPPTAPASPVVDCFRELTNRLATSRCRLQNLIERLEC